MRFAAGFLLALVFAAALLSSLGMTFQLVMHAVECRGDWGCFEAHMRHYSDRFEVTADGSFVSYSVPHPVRSFVIMLVVAWVVTMLVALALHRLFRRSGVWR